MHLDSCKDTWIGDDANPYLKGISGGEKRRLAIGMEILDFSISILLLDEPTSGLDAASAQNIANLLRAFADDEMTIIVTLHQPRTSIMNLFDTMMVLANGRTVFYGPRNAYEEYLTITLGGTIPKYENPYDILLDVLNPALSERTIPLLSVIDKGFSGDIQEELAGIFDKSTLKTNLNCYVVDQRVADTSSVDPLNGESRSILTDVVAWIAATWVLFKRTAVIKMRDPMCLATQVSSGIIMGLIFGTLYWDVYDKSNSNIILLDVQMCLSMTCIMAVWLPYDVTLTFPMERRIFLRERKAGLYSTSAFYIARITADVPSMVVSVVLMGLIVWGMAGLQINLGYFLLILIVAILVGGAMMQCIGAMSRTFEEANIYMMTIMMVSMMLGTGFVREVPSFLQWARDISLMGIVGDMTMYLEFKDAKPSLGTPSEIYDEYGILITDGQEFLMSSIVLLIILIVCRVLCYLFVKFLFTGRRFEENLLD